MESTQWARKLDTQGRIMVPIRLREQMGLVAGTEYNFFIHQEDGRKFLCIECPSTAQMDLEEARRFLEEHGFIVRKSE